MSTRLDKTRARQLLAQGDLRTLFVDLLGWDHHRAKIEVSETDSTLTLEAIAHKRGMVAWHCPAGPGIGIPTYSQRRKIELSVSKVTLEHLIVFSDADRERLIWQWARRDSSRPLIVREHEYNRGQPGDALLQKLESITFTLNEEDGLTLAEVVRRAQTGFDVERVTKAFYEQFQTEHREFLKLVHGIPSESEREWYASLVLNRLMFVYFLQRKGFLDGDIDYFRNRLALMQKKYGKDKFYSFYRYFLVRLFHEGLGSRSRTAELELLLGRIPYLNGGLFDVHELERGEEGTRIQISDKAFGRIFDYFDRYQWHLDDRPLRSDNEINADILGYIFEKYVNRKEMGAYYTKEDITAYIISTTVMPSVIQKCITGVAKDGTEAPWAGWDLIRSHPGRYIRQDGAQVQTSHPQLARAESIAANKPGWLMREDVDRKNLEEMMLSNLDLVQLLQDFVGSCDDPAVLWNIWSATTNIHVLDPTCGSGAFLFAALNVLELLYSAILERMAAFVDESGSPGRRSHEGRFSDFQRILAEIDAHQNRKYFISHN